MVKMSAQGTNPDGGNADWIDRECTCLFMVDGVALDEKGTVKLELSVRADDTGTQKDKKMEHSLFSPEGSEYPDTAKNKIFHMGVALGHLTRPQWREIAEKGLEHDVPVESEANIGRMFFGTVEMKEGKPKPGETTAKKFARLKKTWPLGDEETAGFARDEAAIAAMLQATNGHVWHSEKGWVPYQRPQTPPGGGSAGVGANLPPSTPPAGNGHAPAANAANPAANSLASRF